MPADDWDRCQGCQPGPAHPCSLPRADTALRSAPRCRERPEPALLQLPMLSLQPSTASLHHQQPCNAASHPVPARALPFHKHVRPLPPSLTAAPVLHRPRLHSFRAPPPSHQAPPPRAPSFPPRAHVPTTCRALAPFWLRPVFPGAPLPAARCPAGPQAWAQLSLPHRDPQRSPQRCVGASRPSEPPEAARPSAPGYSRGPCAPLRQRARAAARHSRARKAPRPLPPFSRSREHRTFVEAAEAAPQLRAWQRRAATSPRAVRSAPIGRWDARGGTRPLGTNHLPPALPRGRHFVCGRGPQAPFLLRAAILRSALGASRTNLAVRGRRRRDPSSRRTEGAAGARAPSGGRAQLRASTAPGPGHPTPEQRAQGFANTGIYSSSEVSCVCSFFFSLKKVLRVHTDLTKRVRAEGRAPRPAARLQPGPLSVTLVQTHGDSLHRVPTARRVES